MGSQAGGDQGEVMTRTSSKRWTRNGGFVFKRIQQSASYKVSKSFGAAFTARGESDG